MSCYPYPCVALLDFASWLKYPLIRVGDDAITVLTLVKIVVWVGAILGLNFLVQHLFLRRVLAHTRLNLGLQFAIAKIFGYLFVALGFYIALVVNGVNLSSLAVVAGALGLGLGFGLQSISRQFCRRSGLVGRTSGVSRRPDRSIGSNWNGDEDQPSGHHRDDQ